MKKYLLGIFGFVLLSLLSWGVKADCMNDCLGGCHVGSANYAQCTSSCDTTCPIQAPEKTAAEQAADASAAKQECVGYDTKPDCMNRYSCETLFESDFTRANTCNYNRCMSTRSASYCTCKYGPGGNGPGGIPLNTSLPFIGNCVTKSDGTAGDTAALDAFPTIVSVASRMLVTIILLVSFIMIIIGGVQWAQGDAKSGKAKITKVAIGFALLGMMGAILRLINPNFFK